MNSRKHYKENKMQAKNTILRQLEFFAGLYGVKYNKVAIRNQKTKWGSCSLKGNLNFNYRIAFLPKEQMNYVIVHEVCHLIHFNHSKSFWSAVEKAIPNYKALSKITRRTKIT